MYFRRPRCPACDVGYGCSSSADCASDVCDTSSGVCLTSMPTGLPSPAPTLQPTVTPCPWLEIPDPPKIASAKFSSDGRPAVPHVVRSHTSGRTHPGAGERRWPIERSISRLRPPPLLPPRRATETQFRDSGTDRAGYLGATFDCDELIDFPLVSAASCLWTTSDTLTVTLDYRATCIPGDNVTVLGGLLKPYCSFSDCSCWPLANASGPVQLEPPDVPLTPIAVFVGSQSIGSCSDVNVDLTTSIGSGGRDWAVAEWTVNSSLPDKNLTDIRAFIATWNLAAQVEMTSRMT